MENESREIFEKENEIRLNRNTLKENFIKRYPEYASKEIIVKIYPYSLELWADNKRVYEEMANKGSRYIDCTEQDEELAKEKEEEAKSIYKLREELEELKKQLEEEKQKNKKLEEEIAELRASGTKAPANKMKVGRPAIELKELDMFKIYIEAGYNEKNICEMLEISKATFYRYKRKLRENNLI